MNATTKYPRKLVVHFHRHEYLHPLRCQSGSEGTGLTGYMIQTDWGKYRQLVHKQQLTAVENPACLVEKPSRMSRLAIRLGLRKRVQSKVEVKWLIDEAVEKAYAFLSANYASGDDVILVVYSTYGDASEPLIKAAEKLAKHLYEGTHPSDSSNVRPEDEQDDESCLTKQIPIHCVAVTRWDIPQSITTWNDELKSRFPPGIRHIVCGTCHDTTGWSCSTIVDWDGGIKSRKICVSQNDSGMDMFIYSTKHAIYYMHDKVSKWDRHKPLWTREVLGSPQCKAQGVISPESLPAGMYRHEIRKYKDLPGGWRKFSMLMWKSSRC